MGAGIAPALRLVDTPAMRTDLAGIGGVNVLHLNACQTSLVLNVRGKPVEAPAAQASVILAALATVFVFKTFSCLAADTGKGLQFNDAYTVGDCFIDDSTADLMILVTHPALLFVFGLTDGVQLLCFAQLLSPRMVLPPYEAVLPPVADEPRLSILMDYYSRTEDTEVNAHRLCAGGCGLLCLICYLRNELSVFLGDAQCPQLRIPKGGESVIGNECLQRNAPALTVHPKRQVDTPVQDLVVLIIPDSYGLTKNGELAAAMLLRFGIYASDVPAALCPQDGRQCGMDGGGSKPRQFVNGNGIVQYVVDEGDILPHGLAKQDTLLLGRKKF